MSDLLDSYEQEFQEYTFAVSQRIQKIPKLTGTQKIAEVEAAENEIQEAERLLSSMTLRLRSLNPKEPIVPRIKGYTEEVSKLKKELKKAKTAFGEADRARLLGNATDEISVDSLDHRTRLLHDVEKAEATSDVIREMHQKALEGREIGIGVLNNLEQQSNLVQSMRDRLRSINDSLGQARRLMNSMWRRTVENRVMVIGIILGLLGLIALVLWIKFGDHSSAPATAPPTAASTAPAATSTTPVASTSSPAP